MMNDFVGWLTDPLNLVFTILLVAIFLAFLRLLRGPSMPDRIVALDLMVVITIAFIGVFSVYSEEPLFLEAMIVLALVAFLGTVAFARYLERRSRDE